MLGLLCFQSSPIAWPVTSQITGHIKHVSRVFSQMMIHLQLCCVLVLSTGCGFSCHHILVLEHNKSSEKCSQVKYLLNRRDVLIAGWAFWSARCVLHLLQQSSAACLTRGLNDDLARPQNRPERVPYLVCHRLCNEKIIVHLCKFHRFLAKIHDIRCLIGLDNGSDTIMFNAVSLEMVRRS